MVKLQFWEDKLVFFNQVCLPDKTRWTSLRRCTNRFLIHVNVKVLFFVGLYFLFIFGVFRCRGKMRRLAVKPRGKRPILYEDFKVIMWGKQWSHKRPSPILTIFIGGMKNTLITFSWLPSGKFSHNYGKSPLTMENHHFLLENPLFLWTLTIVFGMFTRPGISIISHRKKDTVVSTYRPRKLMEVITVTSAPQARLTLARVQEDARDGVAGNGPRSLNFLGENRPRCEPWCMVLVYAHLQCEAPKICLLV